MREEGVASLKPVPDDPDAAETWKRIGPDVMAWINQNAYSQSYLDQIRQTVERYEDWHGRRFGPEAAVQWPIPEPDLYGFIVHRLGIEVEADGQQLTLSDLTKSQRQRLLDPTDDAVQVSGAAIGADTAFNEVCRLVVHHHLAELDPPDAGRVLQLVDNARRLVPSDYERPRALQTAELASLRDVVYPAPPSTARTVAMLLTAHHCHLELGKTTTVAALKADNEGATVELADGTRLRMPGDDDPLLDIRFWATQLPSPNNLQGPFLFSCASRATDADVHPTGDAANVRERVARQLARAARPSGTRWRAILDRGDPDEIRQLIVWSWQDGMRWLRDRAFVLAGFFGGFTTAQLRRLRIENCTRTDEGFLFELNGQIHVLRRLTDPRLCPVAAIEAWLEILGHTEGLLFPAPVSASSMSSFHPHQPLTRTATAEIFDRFMSAAGLDGLVPSVMRATFVTHAESAGWRRESIATQLGLIVASHVDKWIDPSFQWRQGASITPLHLIGSDPQTPEGKAA